MTLNTRRSFLKKTLVAGAGAAFCGSLATFGRAAPATSWKFAICNETFQDWPFDKAFDLAAQCGYQGIEVAPFTLANNVRDISRAKRTEVRRQAEKAGLQMIGLHWLLAKTEGYHLTTPDAQVRRATADYFGELARFCAELGGKLLVLGSPKQRNLLPGVSRSDAMKYAADVLHMALPALESTDVTIALEPLNPTTTTFMTTAAEAVELAERVASPRCRLHLDCLAMSSEPTPIPELIRKYRSWFVHFHANDPNGQGPGFGKLDFVPIFQALDEVGYRGWVSVEVFDYKPGPERLARDSIQYMKSCLAKAAEKR